MGSAVPEDAGAASGVVNTTQQVGGALGLGVVSSVAALAGLGAGFLTAAAVLAVGAAVAGRLVPRRAVVEPCTVLRDRPVRNGPQRDRRVDQSSRARSSG